MQNPHGEWYRPMASQSLSTACTSSSSTGIEPKPRVSSCKISATKRFQLSKFGGKKEERSFRAEWCNKYTWLHYDVVKDAAYCYTCMKADKEKRFLFSTKRDPAFITKGFTYWKEATSAFQTHQASKCHCEAVTVLKPKSSDIGELLSKQHKVEKERNRSIFLKILQNIRFLSRQGLALRGGDDLESNFIQLLYFRSIDDPDVKVWLSKKTNKINMYHQLFKMSAFK